jgi:uncharacterized membrane protein YagU involved in acid resistance
MLMGVSTALISYALIRKFSNNNPRIVVPAFALFIIVFSGIYMYISKQHFQEITIYSGILYGLAVMFGLRFFVNGMPCEKLFNLKK